MAKGGVIEIDVTLGMDAVKKDFDTLEKKAREGTKSVAKTVDKIAEAMEKAGSESQKAGQDVEKTAEKMDQSMEKAADSTEELEDAVKGLGDSSEETRKKQEPLGEEQEKTRQKTEQSKESFRSWGEVAKAAVKGVVVAAGTMTAAISMGMGAAAKFGTEYRQASNTIQASTGATKAEMAGLQEVMKNVYASNFGEDMNDVAEAVANVKKNIGGTDEEIESATEAAIGFRDTFGYEVPESTRAAKALMDNFGISARDAYDLMAKGAQNGLDYSGELIDNINEYSVQFGKAGLSAEDMFHIMQAGADSGAWNLDKIGDAVKELNIRLVDGSKTTAEGLAAIGMNADEVAKKMSEGGDTARDTYQKVIRSLADMDDKQAQNIAGVNLFGTMWEDLGPEVIAQLAQVDGAYGAAKGTMEEINRVKYDDAGAALEALKRKMQTALLLPISEEVLPAISDATNEAIGYVDELSGAFASEGVKGLVEKSGDIFAEIAVKAAEATPKMVEVGADFIEQAIRGVQNNKGRLVKAGGDMVIALSGSVVKLLPKELQAPVEDAVEDMVESFSGGGMKRGLKSFENMFRNSFKVVTNMTKAVLPPFVKILDKTVEHLDILIPLAAGGAAAFKGYSVVSDTSEKIKKFSKTIEKLGGKLSVAELATKGWNAATAACGGPVGLAVTGAVALTTAIAAYCLMADDGNRKTYELSESQKKVVESCNSMSQSLRDGKAAREESVAAINREYDGYESLLSELQSITDENGKVKKGYEERADVITGKLSEALGIEIELIDGQIQKYGEVVEAIKDVIVQKKAEALTSSMQEDMAKAYETTTKAMNKYKDASGILEKADKKLKEATEERDKAQEDYNFALEAGSPLVDQYAVNLSNAEGNLQKAASAQKEAQDAVDSARDSMSSFSAEVDNYNALIDAMATGETAKIEAAMTALVTSYKSYNSEALASSQEAREGMYSQAQGYTENMQLIQSGTMQVADSVYQEMAKAAVNSIKEFEKLPGGVSEGVRAIGPEASAAMVAALAQADLDGKLDEEAKKDLKSFLEGFEGLDKETGEKFDMAVQGALEGLENFDEIQTKAEEEGTSFLEALASTLEVHSPSAAVSRIFSQVNPGAMEGLDQGKEGLLEKGRGLVTDFLATLTGEEIGLAGQQAGKYAVDNMSLGITAGTPGVQMAAAGAAQGAKTGLGSIPTIDSGMNFIGLFTAGMLSQQGSSNTAARGVAETSKKAMEAIKALVTGSGFGEQYVKGMNSQKGKSQNAGTTLGKAAKSAMGAVKSTETGTGFGDQYARGISSKSGSARTSGNAIATAARAAAALISAMATGGIFGTQYSGGISGKAGAARGAGSSLASSAKAGAASVDGSREGRNFGQGFINGIGSMIGGAVNAAANLAASALNAVKRTIDSHSPAKKTDREGDNFDQGFINGIVRKAGTAAKEAGNMARGTVKALRENLEPVEMDFDIDGLHDYAASMVHAKVTAYAEPRYAERSKNAQKEQRKEGEINQTINIYQPVKHPVEMKRALRKEARRLAFSR